MPDLSSAQRAYLRKLAHDLRPLVQIGKNGLTEGTITSVEQNLEAHELVKIKFLDYVDERHEIAKQIADETQSALVAVVGHTAILYRPRRDPSMRTITLP
jgi:RNA-binding protein